MAFGLIPARGEWHTKWFEVLSTATFQKGAAVNFDAAYRVREYLSTDSQLLGIALSNSTASTPIRGLNMVAVAVPTMGATAMSDLTTGIAQSSLSIGRNICIYKQGNIASYASTDFGHASRFSAVAQVVGPIIAKTSQVEIALVSGTGALYSNSSTTFAS